jgi:hypothetical protein
VTVDIWPYITQSRLLGSVGRCDWERDLSINFVNYCFDAGYRTLGFGPNTISTSSALTLFISEGKRGLHGGCNRNVGCYEIPLFIVFGFIHSPVAYLTRILEQDTATDTTKAFDIHSRIYNLTCSNNVYAGLFCRFSFERLIYYCHV